VLLPPVDMSIEEQRALGYMPLRDDFEREYKNDAENLISNLFVANNQLTYMNSQPINISTTTTPVKRELSFEPKFSQNGIVSNTAASANLSSFSSSFTFSASSSTTNTLFSSTLVGASLTSSPSHSSSSNEISDDAVDLELKLALIQMYREALVERQRFKKIARDYGLINNASALINNYSYNNITLSNTISTAGIVNNSSNGGVLDNRRRKRNENDKDIRYLLKKSLFAIVLLFLKIILIKYFLSNKKANLTNKCANLHNL
jgi:hypothetical protein